LLSQQLQLLQTALHLRGGEARGRSGKGGRHCAPLVALHYWRDAGATASWGA